MVGTILSKSKRNPRSEHFAVHVPHISRTFPETHTEQEPRSDTVHTHKTTLTYPPDPIVVSKWMCGVGFFVKTCFLRSKGVILVCHRACIRYEAGTIGIRDGQGVRTGRKPRLRCFMLGVRRSRKDTRAFLAAKEQFPPRLRRYLPLSRSQFGPRGSTVGELL